MSDFSLRREMKRFGLILVAAVLFVTSFSYPAPTKVSSQSVPEDPNLAYPIENEPSDESASSEGVPEDSPIYTYPIEGLEPPTAPLPDDGAEPNPFKGDAPLPLPEMVEIMPSEEP